MNNYAHFYTTSGTNSRRQQQSFLGRFGENKTFKIFPGQSYGKSLLIMGRNNICWLKNKNWFKYLYFQYPRIDNKLIMISFLIGHNVLIFLDIGNNFFFFLIFLFSFLLPLMHCIEPCSQKLPHVWNLFKSKMKKLFIGKYELLLPLI